MQISLGWAFLSGPADLEVFDSKAFSDAADLQTLGEALDALKCQLIEEKAGSLIVDVFRTRAALAKNRSVTIRRAALRLAQIIHGSERTATALERARSSFSERHEKKPSAERKSPPSFPGAALFKQRQSLALGMGLAVSDSGAEIGALFEQATELLTKAREIDGKIALKSARGCVSIVRQSRNRVGEVWSDFYRTLPSPICSWGDWKTITKIFANRIALAVPEVIPDVALCREMALSIYEDVVVCKRLKKGIPLYALARFSTEEIEDLFRRYPLFVVVRALAQSNTLELIDRFDRNYRAIRNHLAFLNLQNISQSAAKLPYTMGAKDEAEAIRRAGEVVAAWRAGRWKAGQAYLKEEES